MQAYHSLVDDIEGVAEADVSVMVLSNLPCWAIEMKGRNLMTEEDFEHWNIEVVHEPGIV